MAEETHQYKNADEAKHECLEPRQEQTPGDTEQNRSQSNYTPNWRALASDRACGKGGRMERINPTVSTIDNWADIYALNQSDERRVRAEL